MILIKLWKLIRNFPLQLAMLNRKFTLVTWASFPPKGGIVPLTKIQELFQRFFGELLIYDPSITY